MPSGKTYKTLEPAYRGTSQKIKGKTAIPLGIYDMTRYPSPRNRRIVPLLQNVPGFEYVEIHVGNFVHDTAGCILIGTGRLLFLNQHEELTNCTLQNSQHAFREFMQEFNQLCTQGKVQLVVQNLKGLKIVKSK